MIFNRFTPLVKQDIRGVDTKSKSLFYNAKSRAKNKDLDFNLDINWVINNITPMRCQLTNQKLTLNQRYKNNKIKYNSCSIHRLSPNKGYIKQNCVIIANSVNMMISDHNIDDVLLVSSAITSSRNIINLHYK
jgi:hypothetical protein